MLQSARVQAAAREEENRTEQGESVMPTTLSGRMDQMKIISGGQTGVDRAALDVAIELGIPHGGYCPKGRRAEDGRIPERYHLVELSNTDYPYRTKNNLFISTGTLILNVGPLRGGTLLTRRVCAKYHKPSWVTDLDDVDERELEAVKEWVTTHGETLNIAGPRESRCLGIYEKARIFLIAILVRSGDPNR